MKNLKLNIFISAVALNMGAHAVSKVSQEDTSVKRSQLSTNIRKGAKSVPGSTTGTRQSVKPRLNVQGVQKERQQILAIKDQITQLERQMENIMTQSQRIRGNAKQASTITSNTQQLNNLVGQRNNLLKKLTEAENRLQAELNKLREEYHSQSRIHSGIQE